jgi:hypothetical protein
MYSKKSTLKKMSKKPVKRSKSRLNVKKRKVNSKRVTTKRKTKKSNKKSRKSQKKQLGGGRYDGTNPYDHGNKNQQATGWDRTPGLPEEEECFNTFKSIKACKHGLTPKCLTKMTTHCQKMVQL